MRLINTSSGELKERIEEPLPDYGTLSHRWGPDSEEVSFKQFSEGSKVKTAGYPKSNSS